MPDLPVKDAPACRRSSCPSSTGTTSCDRCPRCASRHRPSKLQRPKVDLPDAVAKFEWPRVDLSSIDVPKALAGVAAAAQYRTARPAPALAARASAA